MLNVNLPDDFDSQVSAFAAGLHQTTTLISYGVAAVCGRNHDAVEVRNLYGQHIVWGKFNVERGKYRGKRLANNANTDEVVYTVTKALT